MLSARVNSALNAAIAAAATAAIATAPIPAAFPSPDKPFPALLVLSFKSFVDFEASLDDSSKSSKAFALSFNSFSFLFRSVV